MWKKAYWVTDQKLVRKAGHLYYSKGAQMWVRSLRQASKLNPEEIDGVLARIHELEPNTKIHVQPYRPYARW